MLKFLPYYTFNVCFDYIWQYICMKFKRKSNWKKYDSYNHLISKIQTKFSLKSTIFSNFIEIEELRTSIRKNSSDAEVLFQIWFHEEYKKPIEIIKNQIKIGNEPIIFDIGANIGMASLYFKNKFPQAKIYSFEPFEANRDRISKEFTISSKALWKTNTKLETSLNFRDGKDWSVQVIETESGIIQGATLSNLMEDFNVTSIDILKVDVEGSEYPALLEDNTIGDTLTRVKAIVIEIHDDAGNRNDLYTKLKECHFINYPLGELDVFINEKFIA